MRMDAWIHTSPAAMAWRGATLPIHAPNPLAPLPAHHTTTHPSPCAFAASVYAHFSYDQRLHLGASLAACFALELIMRQLHVGIKR